MKKILTSGYGPGRVSLTESILVSSLNNLNAVINSLDKWDLFYNCSSFAIAVWNAASDNDLKTYLIPTPTRIIDEQKERDGHLVERPIIGDIKRGGHYEGNSFISTVS
ncbi:MAG: hypothetical protein LBR37_00750 [Erysipelotrichaceae bacterium]|jgi:hypothetical protein|nr:hypothetical protein [Erysipelotrichaceae bacterium]